MATRGPYRFVIIPKSGAIDLRFVEREMAGRELLTLEERPSGANLTLTAAGRAAAASGTGKRRRSG